MYKRGQFWYMDFIIGLLIITMVSIVFVVVVKDIAIRQYTTDKLTNAGASISSSFMSAGYDYANWENKQGRIGLLKEDYKVDLMKLQTMNELTSTQEGYQTTKFLLGIQEDYLSYIEYINPVEKTMTQSEIIGKPETSPDLIEEQNIRIIRHVYYDPTDDGMANGQISRMVIIVWKE